MKLKLLSISCFISLLAAVQPAAAKTLVVFGVYDISFEGLRIGVMIDKCVIAQEQTFKEINANEFEHTIYCRDFDDPTGTIYPIKGIKASRSGVKARKADPENQPGQVWQVRFTIPAKDIRWDNWGSGSGYLDFKGPFLYDSRDNYGLRRSPFEYLAPLAEIERDYGRKLSPNTRPASSVVYPHRVGDKGANEEIRFAASSSNTSTSNTAKNTRPVTISDILNGGVGQPMADFTKQLGKPISEKKKGNVIELAWRTQNDSCNFMYYFAANTPKKEAIGWNHTCEEGEGDYDGTVPISTPKPKPYKGW